MDALPSELPDDPAELKQLLQQQQALLNTTQLSLARKQKVIDRKDKALADAQQRVDRFRESVVRKQSRIETLEEILRRLQRHRFGSRSEKSPDQLHLFNEAELLAEAGAEVETETEAVEQVSAHQRKRRKSRALPADLPRVEVVYDLTDEEKQCSCGRLLQPIGDEVLEQLAVIPQQYYVIRHLRKKYACACKGCLRTATMPKQPLPATGASPQLLAQVMVAKYFDGLPLYRQEKIARRDGLDLPRAKLARWMIDGATVFQPLYNLIQEVFFSYDIAMSDDTGIQVLKEDGRRAENKSYLWIRRGGPPEKPVVLVDYSPSKSGETAYGLLSEFHGYLVCDAASNFNQSVRRNGLVTVWCNDHARRRFHSVVVGFEDQEAAKQSIAQQGIDHYRELYRIEREIKDLSPQEKYAVRQKRAVPLWDVFIEWATTLQVQGVAHEGTRDALSYLLNHADGLRRYCDDGRLPISNILSEHVAKTIALARKNFLFADTPAGAVSSARIYSLLESAKANGHHPQRYLSVVLTELPNATTVADIEALLPWNLTPGVVAERYAAYPAPP